MGFVVGVPLKAILSYWADTQNEAALVSTLVGQGYAICDGSTLDSSHQDINVGGTYTLPDLRNKFLLGGDITKTAGTAGSSVGSGTENSATGAPGPKGVGGNNSHTLSTAETPSHSHTILGGTGQFQMLSGTLGAGNLEAGATGIAAGTGYTGFGQVPTTDAVGSGNAHESRPLYTGIIWIMKVKN